MGKRQCGGAEGAAAAPAGDGLSTRLAARQDLLPPGRGDQGPQGAKAGGTSPSGPHGAKKEIEVRATAFYMLEPILGRQEREAEGVSKFVCAQEAGPIALSGGLRVEEVRTLLRGLGQRVSLEALHHHQHVAELDEGLPIGAFLEAREDSLTICDARETDDHSVQGVARLAEA